MNRKWCIGIAGCLFAVLVVFSAYAALQADPVHVSNFQYTNAQGPANTLIAGDDIWANFDITGNADCSYVAAMMYYNGGILVDMDVKEGSVKAGETTPNVQLTVSLSDTLQNPEIVTVIWDNLQNMKPLTSPAWFGSADSSLYTLSINNKPLSLEEGLFQYSRMLIAGEESLDYSYQAIPKDLTAVVSTAKENGMLKIAVDSHDGTSRQEYSVETSITVPDIVVEKFAYGTCYTGAVTLESLDGSPTSEDLRSQWRSYANVGSSIRAFMQFDIPAVFDVCEIESAVLHLYVKSNKLGDDAIEVAAYQAPSNWYENMSGALNCSVNSLPTMGTAKLVTVDNGEEGPSYVAAKGYKKIELPLDMSKVSDGKLTLLVTQNHAPFVAESGDVAWTNALWSEAGKDDILYINTTNATDEDGNCMMPYITLHRKGE